jgi:hypothetical protein
LQGLLLGKVTLDTSEKRQVSNFEKKKTIKKTFERQRTIRPKSRCESPPKHRYFDNHVDFNSEIGGVYIVIKGE